MAKNSAFKFYIKKLFVFGVTYIEKSNDKRKYVHSSYGITFDGKAEWNFVSGSGRNVLIFDVDNISSSHTGIRNNYFLVLGEGDTFGINGSFGAPEKKFSISFSNANTKFCLNLHYMLIITICLVTEKKIYKFSAINKNVNFPN